MGLFKNTLRGNIKKDPYWMTIRSSQYQACPQKNGELSFIHFPNKMSSTNISVNRKILGCNNGESFWQFVSRFNRKIRIGDR